MIFGFQCPAIHLIFDSGWKPMPEEHISPILCLDSFLGTLPFSLHFSILVVSQRGNVSVTPLSGVTMIKFYFASKTGYKYKYTADTDWMCVRLFGKYFILIYYSVLVLSVLLGYQRLWDSTAFEQQIKMTLADPHFLLLYFYFSLSIFILLIFPMLGLQLGDTLRAFTSCCRWGKGTVSTVSHTPVSRQGSPKPAAWLGGFSQNSCDTLPQMSLVCMKRVFEWTEKKSRLPVTRYQGSVLCPEFGIGPLAEVPVAATVLSTTDAIPPLHLQIKLKYLELSCIKIRNRQRQSFHQLGLKGAVWWHAPSIPKHMWHCLCVTWALRIIHHPCRWCGRWSTSWVI